MTGSKGETENLYNYDAFGSLLERRECVENRILYTGQQYDGETEQYYLRARYYNPVIGRFMQKDTYRGDGLNLYAYCANNPVRYYDPGGHKPNSCNPPTTTEPGIPPATSGIGKGSIGTETIYPIEKTHESARNTLMNLIDGTEAFKNGSDPYYGRLESSYGYNKQIGRQSFDGKVRWRLDYDPDQGVHFNFEDFTTGKGSNATKIVIPIDINYDDYMSIINWYNQ